VVLIKTLPLTRLTDADVRQLVLQSLDLVQSTRDDLNIPLFTRIEETAARLKQGELKARRFHIRRSGNVIAKTYGYFQAPSTIVLDEDLLLEGQRFHQAELATTATYYSAVHEVIHADDFTHGNRLTQDTLQHIQRAHRNEIADVERILSKYAQGSWERTPQAIINTWAYQYIDSATHYRTYVVLKHHHFPELDTVWVSLYNSIFSPRLLTTLEDEKGLQYTASLLSEHIGETCIVEIAREYDAIGQTRLRQYTV
jgi:ribosomal protein L25 (general stress protein Ctc)